MYKDLPPAAAVCHTTPVPPPNHNSLISISIQSVQLKMEPALRNHKPLQVVDVNDMYYTGGFCCWPAHLIVDNIVAA